LPRAEFEDWELERIDGKLGVISTLGKDGAPHSAPVMVSVESGTLRFETDSDSQKLRNIQRDPRVAILVFGQPKWGVMVQGMAEVLSKGAGKEQAQIRVVPQRKASWRRKEG
jgi:PPOX class probable F420-dependent enzyme